MTTFPDWQSNNEAYLAATLNWLRLRLEWYAAIHHPSEIDVATPVPPAPPPAASPVRLRWPGRPPAIALPQSSAESAQDHVLLDAADARRAAEATEPPPALIVLSQRLGLSAFERDVLALCAALELDTRTAGLCARAQHDPRATYPTFALALGLFEDAVWDVLSPERPLRYWRLIEITQPAGQPLSTSQLRADERIVNCIKGLNYLDDRLEPLLSPLRHDSAAASLPPSQAAVVDAIVRRWSQAQIGPPTVIQLVGADVPSKQLVAGRAAGELGRQLYRLPAELLPSQPGDLETLARLWQRESMLLPVACYIDAQEIETGAGSGGQAGPLARFLGRGDGLLFLGTRDVWPALGSHAFAVDVSPPSAAEQHEAWNAALGEDAGDLPDMLASQFQLSLDAINEIAAVERADTAAQTPDLATRVWDACRARVRPRLDALAQPLEPKASWDDIVLPAAELGLLRQITDQVRHRRTVYERWGFGARMNRGLGISALFAGPSGTGKTMAAEVIANDLRLNLYRIDLSAVVSKYIGETEKNLRRLFDAAEEGGALLFFDEADALFGRRSEVKDSHDRYANIEINYLLQRMEAYRGLAILASNAKNALDQAFLRRLRFIVSFPFPAAAERRTMWEKVFPVETPLGEIDLDRLTRLPTTGSMIHNIALNAAFMAARQNTDVDMQLLLDAGRAEFRKLELPIPERDFAWEVPA